MPAFPTTFDPHFLARYLRARYPVRQLRAALVVAPLVVAPLVAPNLPLVAWAATYLLVKDDARGTTAPMQAESLFHRWLVAELDLLHTRRGSKRNVIAPRGSAKTTWACLAYPLRCTLEGHERYVQIVSDTAGQARQNLENIRAELESNEVLCRAYPRATGKGPVWTQDRIRLRNGATIEALGMGSALRGRRQRWERPTLIITDDPERDEHVTSALLRTKSRAWFCRAVMNAGSPSTNYLVLGTKLHRECLVAWLEKQPGWQSQLFQSIVTWPQRMDKWLEWESIFNDYERSDREEAARAFYEENRALMDE